MLERNDGNTRSFDNQLSLLQKENGTLSGLYRMIAALSTNSKSIERKMNHHCTELEWAKHKLTEAMTQHEHLLKIIDDLRDQINKLPSLSQWRKVKDGFLSLKEKYDVLVKKQGESADVGFVDTVNKSSHNKVRVMALKGISMLEEEGINIHSMNRSIVQFEKMEHLLDSDATAEKNSFQKKNSTIWNNAQNFLEMDRGNIESTRFADIMKDVEDVLMERNLMPEKYMDVLGFK